MSEEGQYIAPPPPKTGDVWVGRWKGAEVRIVVKPDPQKFFNYALLSDAMPPVRGLTIEHTKREALAKACAELDAMEHRKQQLIGVIEAIEGADIADIERRNNDAAAATKAQQ